MVPPAESSPAALRITVAADVADLVSGLLWELACSGIEERTSGALTELIAGFVDRAAAECAAADIRVAGASPHIEIVDLGPDQESWLDAWRPYARVERAGPFTV